MEKIRLLIMMFFSIALSSCYSIGHDAFIENKNLENLFHKNFSFANKKRLFIRPVITTKISDKLISPESQVVELEGIRAHMECIFRQVEYIYPKLLIKKESKWLLKQ